MTLAFFVRTFLGFLLGAILAALLLQYFREGHFDLEAVSRPLGSVLLGALAALAVLLGLFYAGRWRRR